MQLYVNRGTGKSDVQLIICLLISLTRHKRPTRDTVRQAYPSDAAQKSRTPIPALYCDVNSVCVVPGVHCGTGMPRYGEMKHSKKLMGKSTMGGVFSGPALNKRKRKRKELSQILSILERSPPRASKSPIRVRVQVRSRSRL